MYKSGKAVSFWAAVSLGIGSMIGAGIFALMGEAGAIAGPATYLSFIIGGIIALFSGYSLGKLGARYPAAGGIVEYLAQAFGPGLFTGGMSVALYISAMVALSLIAKTFGSYAASLFGLEASMVWVNIFSVSIIGLAMLVNLSGAKDVARWEKLLVGTKFLVLFIFAAAGLIVTRWALLEPARYPAPANLFYSLAITFFAYEGFRVITNAAEDMPNPAKTLPQAIVTSIFLVMVLYVCVALAVFGNLLPDEVIKAKDYAIAEAALPVFGQAGFIVVSITALISTASSINANLYAVTNVTYQMAKDGELPNEFGKPIEHSREGLVISSGLVTLMAVFFDLSEIAAVGSISILFVHAVTHIGHLKLRKQTGALPSLVVLALLLTVTALLLALYYEYEHSRNVTALLLSFVAAAVGIELIVRKSTGRRIRRRTPEKSHV